MAGSPGLRPVLERLARLSRHDPHDPDLRMVVQARAQDACEYCDPRRGGPLGARHRAIVEGRYPPPWARDWGY